MMNEYLALEMAYKAGYQYGLKLVEDKFYGQFLKGIQDAICDKAGEEIDENSNN